MKDYNLTLDDAVRILLDANTIYKKGRLPLAIYLAHVSKDYFKKCENELGISLCDDIIDNGIITIREKVYLATKEKGGRLTPNRLEREIAASEDVVDLSYLMVEDTFNNLEEMRVFYNRLVKGDFVYPGQDIPFRNN